MIRAHFDAVEALLTPVLPPDIRVHDTDASRFASSEASYPFIVLSAGGVMPFSESLSDTEDGASGYIRVTHTALSPNGVRTLMDRTRPALEGTPLAVPGRAGWRLRLWDHQDVTVDRDVQIGTLFPYFAVDVYRLGSTTI